MDFGQILVKIFSQTRKLENSMSFDPISLNLKSLNSKNFYNFETRNTQTQTPKRQLHLNPKKPKLDQALIFRILIQIAESLIQSSAKNSLCCCGQFSNSKIGLRTTGLLKGGLLPRKPLFSDNNAAVEAGNNSSLTWKKKKKCIIVQYKLVLSGSRPDRC